MSNCASAPSGCSVPTARHKEKRRACSPSPGASSRIRMEAGYDDRRILPQNDTSVSPGPQTNEPGLTPVSIEVVSRRPEPLTGAVPARGRPENRATVGIMGGHSHRKRALRRVETPCRYAVIGVPRLRGYGDRAIARREETGNVRLIKRDVIGEVELQLNHFDDPIGYHVLRRPTGKNPQTGYEYDWESVADGALPDVILAYVRALLDLGALEPVRKLPPSPWAGTR